MKVAIIGAGLIGKKRAMSLSDGVKLEVVCNRSSEKGQQMAREFGCRYESDWRKVVKNSSIDAVFIATSHDSLTQITVEAIKNGKHVLVEKPGARNFKEFEKIIKAYKKNQVVVMFGYNHRFHPSIQKAKEIIDSKKYGKVLFVRARYGHGARLGYEKEWRFQKAISGGGELVDQGPHLIDLVNYLVGAMDKVVGFTPTLFWKTKSDDSAFFILKQAVSYLLMH
jgi:predicted dehydrogenase